MSFKAYLNLSNFFESHFELHFLLKNLHIKPQRNGIELAILNKWFLMQQKV